MIPSRTKRCVPACKATKTNEACKRRSAGTGPCPGGGELLLYIFARSRRECERVPLFPAAGGDGMEDWWTYLPALARRGEKNQMATAGHDAEFPGVIAHADSSHTSYSH